MRTRRSPEPRGQRGMRFPAAFFSAHGISLRIHSRRTMNPNTILWIYIVLLIVGGLIGFFEGKSKVSLIMAVVCAIILTIAAVPAMREMLPAEVQKVLADAVMVVL